jgi:L-2-hydroxyglutarate oxidase LhgO
MRALLVLIVVLLAISNYGLVQDRQQLVRENEQLDYLVHAQQKSSDALLSSLGSCRDTLDTMTQHNQIKVLKIAETMPEVLAQVKKKKSRLPRWRRRKKPFKPYFIL